MSQKVQLFPARANVGIDAVTPEWFNIEFAKKMVQTGLWSYTPVANSQDDIKMMLDKAKSELSQDALNNKAESERLKAEREELEALRAELLTAKGRKKAEV